LSVVADSAILLVREESGNAPPELIQLDELVGSIGAELRDQNLDVTETTIEPVKVRASRLTLNPRAAQSHHQRSDARHESPG
jgi:hypothetical protein